MPYLYMDLESGSGGQEKLEAVGAIPEVGGQSSEYGQLKLWLSTAPRLSSAWGYKGWFGGQGRLRQKGKYNCFHLFNWVVHRVWWIPYLQSLYGSNRVLIDNIGILFVHSQKIQVLFHVLSCLVGLSTFLYMYCSAICATYTGEPLISHTFLQLL